MKNSQYQQDPSESALRVWECSSAQVPLSQGLFKVRVFRNNQDTVEHLVISQGQFEKGQPPFLRIHSECFTGETLGSQRCDCRQQLDNALGHIAGLGYGLIIYMRGHEGRGIGLGNKIQAYQLQDEGYDTVSANRALGFPTDLRDFSVATEILKILGINEVRLNTNNPAKIEQVQAEGIKVLEVIPALVTPNPHNYSYLQTKFQHMGHRLAGLFSAAEN